MGGWLGGGDLQGSSGSVLIPSVYPFIHFDSPTCTHQRTCINTHLPAPTPTTITNHQQSVAGDYVFVGAGSYTAHGAPVAQYQSIGGETGSVRVLGLALALARLDFVLVDVGVCLYVCVCCGLHFFVCWIGAWGSITDRRTDRRKSKEAHTHIHTYTHTHSNEQQTGLRHLRGNGHCRLHRRARLRCVGNLGGVRHRGVLRRVV
jgi:hypothetical protein